MDNEQEMLSDKAEAGDAQADKVDGEDAITVATSAVEKLSAIAPS